MYFAITIIYFYFYFYLSQWGRAPECSAAHVADDQPPDGVTAVTAQAGM